MKGRKPLKPRDYPDLLKKIKGSREEEIINFAVLRSLKQARYSKLNVGHFGLASECYTHFTSPIRRYPDLIVHRILREVLQKNGFQMRGERSCTMSSLIWHTIPPAWNVSPTRRNVR